MDDITVPKGDKGYNLAFTVQDAAGDAYNLTDYTITLKVWTKSVPGTLLIDSACVPDVEASGTCHYVVAAGDFDVVGRFRAEVELTKAGVIESTETFEIIVVESG